MKRFVAVLLLMCACAGVFAGCGAASASQGSVRLILGAYSAPSQAFVKVIPLFQAYWKQQTGQTVTFQQSYLGSGAQSRAIINGFRADVAALSVTPDVNAIAKAGLITHDWTRTATKGMITESVVAFAVRKGNPKNIHDWADLARPGVQILTPNPATSGGAQWNILALYGAALRGQVAGVAANDPTAASSFLEAALRNVKVMDKDARTSITTFEKGIGDVAITYESEVLYARQKGESDELVIPSSTILIQNPAAIVDIYAKQHGVQKAAQAFVSFLTTPSAQQAFASIGYRPVVPASQQTASTFAPIKDLWTIDYLGGWTKVATGIFGASGIYTKAIAAAQS